MPITSFPADVGRQSNFIELACVMMELGVTVRLRNLLLDRPKPVGDVVSAGIVTSRGENAPVGVQPERAQGAYGDLDISGPNLSVFWRLSVSLR